MIYAGEITNLNYNQDLLPFFNINFEIIGISYFSNQDFVVRQ
jgi:hypothetical protein